VGAPPGGPYAGAVNIEEIAVSEWLPLPDVAERLGTDVATVRKIVQDDRLIAVPVGERRVRSVPADFLVPGPSGRLVVLPALAGTLVLLRDAGFSDEEAVAWLFEPDPTLETLGNNPAGGPRTPVAALAAGFKTEIRRRAQALGF